MDLTAIAIPAEIKELTLPAPEEVTYWGLQQKRTYWIDYEIDEDYSLIELAKEIVRINIEDKDKETKEPITLYIHSYGGDLRQAIFFCDLIESSSVPIITVATGAAMSAGLLIFLAGKRRYAFKHTNLMLHQGHATLSGSYDEIVSAQKSYDKEVEDMKTYILEHTNIDEKTFNKNKSKDWYLVGDELLKYGVVDKIIESFSDII